MFCMQIGSVPPCWEHADVPLSLKCNPLLRLYPLPWSRSAIGYIKTPIDGSKVRSHVCALLTFYPLERRSVDSIVISQCTVLHVLYVCACTSTRARANPNERMPNPREKRRVAHSNFPDMTRHRHTGHSAPHTHCDTQQCRPHEVFGTKQVI